MKQLALFEAKTYKGTFIGFPTMGLKAQWFDAEFSNLPTDNDFMTVKVKFNKSFIPSFNTAYLGHINQTGSADWTTWWLKITNCSFVYQDNTLTYSIKYEII